MSVLADLQTTLGGLQIPIETGVFTDKAPDQYMVVVPLSDTFELHADNTPEGETQEARISIYTQGSYTKAKNAIVRTLFGTDMYITDRRYIGFETDTGYHHYVIDVAKIYELEV